MIEILMNQPRELSFNLSIAGGATPVTPIARFVIQGINDIGITFKCDIVDGHAVVTLPLLKDFMGILKEGIAKAQLEVMLSGSYFVPWSDQILLKNPIIVSASIDPEPDFCEAPIEAFDVQVQEPEMTTPTLPSDDYGVISAIGLHPNTFREEEEKNGENDRQTDSGNDPRISERDLPEETKSIEETREETQEDKTTINEKKKVPEKENPLPSQEEEVNPIAKFLDFNGKAGSFFDS